MTKPLGLGIAGYGFAGQMMAAAASLSCSFHLVAVADPAVDRQEEARRAGASRVYSGLEDLLDDADVRVVYLATPTQHHAAGVVKASHAGRHVIVEKPFATAEAEARVAVEAASAAQIALLVGATRSFDAPVGYLRKLVAAGNFGPLQTISSLWSTDWLTRPRATSDLQGDLGGGIINRQGSHQVDVLRTVVGTTAESVRASTMGGSDGTERGYSALIFFEGGVSATAVYQGWGGFDSRLLTFGRGELGELAAVPPDDPRRAFVPYLQPAGADAGTVPPSAGFLWATFLDVDVVPSPKGWFLIERTRVTEETVDPWPSGWDAVLIEMERVLDGHASPHDGLASLATMEVCAAIKESSRVHAEVALSPYRLKAAP